MISIIAEPERAVASIFNSAIAAAAIGAAWEVGLLDALKEQKKLDVLKFAAQRDLDSRSMQGLATALAVADILSIQSSQDTDMVLAARLFDEAYRTKSLFHWLSLGSGGLFSSMQYIVRNKNRQDVNTMYRRDHAAISYSCADINLHHFDRHFWDVINGLDYQFHSVVDLGSGSGERLMQILTRYPGTNGIGIDLAGPPIEVAAAAARQRGLADRLYFTEGDARQMAYRDDFAQVDLLTCFMMGHDFWPRENCVVTLQRLRKAFPSVGRFLLGDTTRILLDSPDSKYAVTDDNVPIFTLGFELGHALMGVYLPTIEEWEDVFVDGGWRCVKRHIIPSPSCSVIFELEHA